MRVRDAVIIVLAGIGLYTVITAFGIIDKVRGLIP